ncbi:uncharacterized protein F4812DRAFT_466858 [Daldinia caldariorum]|uniref:uncharacterized protein n=1 Tax=Daldinia caldariorum TaxID=326644 RepID=UPI00200720BA|nr:uncharacterized protein F4812DRAFT_466858 [Daldinia caldariorum]KAI1464943.1 hypothetical protein F4812DRAFT_466858 [Daldinia caldariorum]
MGALGALGLACNILQLIECGYKAVAMVKDLHGTGQDATESNINTEFVARETRKLSLRLTKGLPASNLTEDEEAIFRLAQQCSKLSSRLLTLIESLKIKRPGSKLDTISTVLRNMRKKSERDQLQASPDDCRKQLRIQMDKMSQYVFLPSPIHAEFSFNRSSDLAQKLQNVLSTTSIYQTEVLQLREHVLKLQSRIAIDSNNMVEPFSNLRRTVEFALKHAAIFQRLRYPKMNDRFDNVETAHEKTFEWLLRSSEPPSNAGEKRLIVAKAFFWRLGNDEQKSRTGLVTCLLHQLLKAAPELIQVAFPSDWKPDSEETSLTNPDILGAFIRLLRNPLTFENCQIIFFIDGLDEFEGRPIGLIKDIISWTELCPRDLKICVSSQPWNEFKLGFREYPGLRIHEWTRDDIRTFIHDSFEELSKMPTLVSKQDLNSLADLIVGKAEGVSLWVRVVIAAIERND